MDIPPPSYAALFTEESTIGSAVLVTPPSPQNAPRLGAAEASTPCGFAASGVYLRPHGSGMKDVTPTSAPGGTLSSETHLGVEGNMRLQMVSIQEQVDLLRRDIIARLPPPLLRDVTDTSTSPLPSPSFSQEDGAAEWRRLLLWQQKQIETLDRTLRSTLSSTSAGKTTALQEEDDNREREKKGQGEAGKLEEGILAVDTGSVMATTFQVTTADSHRDAAVDLVEMLTSFYNLPAAQCWRCHGQLPNTFGEELVAAALGTTSRCLLDKYVSLLVMRLNDSCADVGAKEARRAVVLGARKSEATENALGHLPPSVLKQVLERTQFPSEIPVYRIAFVACELHHARCQSSHSTTSITRFLPPATDVCVSSCHCKEDDAEMLLHGVRFLWLPICFLEDEIRRHGGLGLTLEASHCALYAGLLLRLRQAIRLKMSLKGTLEAVGETFSDACTSEVFLAELRRVRPSYAFLSLTEKRRLQEGEVISVPNLRQMQERCDASCQ